MIIFTDLNVSDLVTYSMVTNMNTVKVRELLKYNTNLYLL